MTTIWRLQGIWHNLGFLSFPSPSKHLAHKVLLWLSSSSKEIFQWTSTLVTFWSPYSCTSLWQDVPCTWRFLLRRSSTFAQILEPLMVIQSSRSHWFFGPWKVLGSSRPYLILEPLELLVFASLILGSSILKARKCVKT